MHASFVSLMHWGGIVGSDALVGLHRSISEAFSELSSQDIHQQHLLALGAEQRVSILPRYVFSPSFRIQRTERGQCAI